MSPERSEGVFGACGVGGRRSEGARHASLNASRVTEFNNGLGVTVERRREASPCFVSDPQRRQEGQRVHYLFAGHFKPLVVKSRIIEGIQ
jgi:hypothetical protein